MTIWFDMDGTLANFYGVENWLQFLISSDVTPYRVAKPLVNMNTLAKTLHKAQRQGYQIGIISWLAKGSTSDYDEAVAETKMKWLKKHLRSVDFDEIHIVPYGTPKYQFAAKNDILFDDEFQNRESWGNNAYDVQDIIGTIKDFLRVGF